MKACLLFILPPSSFRLPRTPSLTVGLPPCPTIPPETLIRAHNYYAARSPTFCAPPCLLLRACHGDFGVDQRRRTDPSGARGRPRSLLRAGARVRASRLRASPALLPTPRGRRRPLARGLAQSLPLARELPQRVVLPHVALPHNGQHVPQPQALG